MLKGKNLGLITMCACMAVVVIIIALQFLPFWTFVGKECGEQTVSIGEYMWFPNSPVADEFEKFANAEAFAGQGLDVKYKVVNAIVMFPAISFGLACAAFVFAILKRKTNFIPSVMATIAALANVISYATNAALRMSDNWVLHLIIAIVALVIAAGALVMNILAKKAQAKQ